MGGNQEKKLTLIVDLVNRTEKKFKEVYDNLEQIEKRTENTRRAMREVGLVGTAALAGLAYAAKGAIQEASNLTESVNAVNVVFGEGADKIHEFGKNAATSVGLATSEFNQMATLTGALLKDTGLNMGQVGDMTTVLTQRAADMASVFNTDVKDAMEAINQAIRGETEGIRRYAGNVTVAELETEALAQGINKSVTEMTEQEKRLLRVSVIMRQTAVTAGDFANTSDSLANRQRILSAQFQNMSAKLGTQLIPLVESLYNTIAPLVTKLGEWIEANPTLARNIVLVVGAIAALMAIMLPLSFAFGRMTMVVGTAMGALTKLNALMLLLGKKTVDELVRAIGSKLVLAFKNFTGATGTATKSLFTFANVTKIAGNVFRIGLLAAAVWGATKIYELAKAFGVLVNTVGGWGNAMKLTLNAVKTKILDWATTALEALATVVNFLPGIDNAFSDTIETLKNKSAESEEALGQMAFEMGYINDASDEMAGAIDESAFDISGSMGDILSAVGKTSEGSEEYMEKLAETVGNIRDEIRETYDDMAKATADFQKSIGQEQMSYEEDVVDTVAKAYEKKKELERELKAVKREDDPSNDEIQKLQDQIDEQEDIITSYKDMQLQLDDEVAERRKYLRMNELEQLQADHEHKLELMKKEYLEDQVQQLQKILRLKQEEQYVLNSLDVQKRAALEAELQKQMSHRQTLENQKAGLSSWIDETTQMYRDYVKNINDALGDIQGSGRVKVSFTSGGSLSGRASGGPVQPGRPFMVGEKGPELFVPGQHGIISPNGRSGGGSVNIYFTGNTFTGEKYADEIKRKIVRDLQQTMRLSV